MMIEELLMAFHRAVLIGSPILCLIITVLVFTNKKRQLIIYEKHDSILVLEILLLVIGILTIVFWGVG